MADDIEELLDEVESKFIHSGSALPDSQHSSVLTVKKNGVEQVGEELETAIHSICSIPEPIETTSIVPDVSLHLNKGPNRKCTVVYVGDSSASSGISGGVTQRKGKRNKKSPLQYFTTIGGSKAMCKICSQVLPQNPDSHNLIEHYDQMHHPQRKRKSFVWKYFSVVADFQALCSFCCRVISFKGGGTPNLVRHIRIKHNIFLKSCRAGRKSSVPEYPSTVQTVSCPLFARKPKISPGLVNHSAKANPETETSAEIIENLDKVIERVLIKLICKEYMPFEFIVSDSFQRFVKELNPYCVLPIVEVLSGSLLDDYHAAEKLRVQRELKTADYVALTIDQWISASDESFLSLTSHFLNESTELKSLMLECFQYFEWQTEEILKERIESICEEWSIKEKIVFVTIASVSDAVKMAVSSMGVKHVPCLASTLDIVVKAALLDIESSRTAIKRIVEHFKSTPAALNKLKEMQIRHGEKESELVNDVTARWISTYEMFQSVIAVKDSLMEIIVQDYPYLPRLNKELIDVVKSASQLLGIFKNIVEEISSEKKITVSEVLVISDVLIHKCQPFLVGPSIPGEVQNMAETFVIHMRIYFHRVAETKVFSEATLLDPRFKECMFKTRFLCTEAVFNIKQLAAKIDLHQFENYVKDLEEPKLKNSLSDSIWEDFDRDVEKDLINNDPNYDAMKETDKFLQEPLLRRRQDPLKWWHENKNIYPRLYQLVKQRMCIATTSVFSERLFSKSGNLFLHRRNIISSQHVSKILFLSHNL